MSPRMKVYRFPTKDGVFVRVVARNKVIARKLAVETRPDLKFYTPMETYAASSTIDAIELPVERIRWKKGQL